VWEVLEAAKTKPFGFMKFEPGPGLGGHCIPIDPFYLTWKAREFGVQTKFIELAGDINTSMPRYVVTRLMEALSDRGRALRGANILLLGLAYKKNIDDPRESPTFAIWDLLRARQANVYFHDPYIPVAPPMREYPAYAGTPSVPLTEAVLAQSDAVVICTAHDGLDYGFVVRHAKLVIDTRNACAGLPAELLHKVVKA
jgi:UDP-N-acetyl-D-glucosamine dehydrogenase